VQWTSLPTNERVDPLELRLKNYAEKDLNENKPFSSKELRECYRQGAERFGWANRNLEPRAMREGNNLIGWGLATGVWEALYQKASAKAILSIDGKLTVSSATADIGTGTYTIVTQADIHDIDVIFVEENDSIVNPIGVKGLGEIGIVGVAGAIANAVFHATGKRIRDLPITLDKLL
jgi:CO/xanthine dehydrogenase Mo-binding subunit